MNALLNLVLSMENDVVAADYDSAADNGSDAEPYEDYDEMDNPTDEPAPNNRNQSNSKEEDNDVSSNQEESDDEQIESTPVNIESVPLKSSSVSKLDGDDFEKDEKELCLASSSKSARQTEKDTKPSPSSDKTKPKGDAIKKREKLDSGIVDDVEEGQSTVANSSSSPDATTGSEQMDYNSSEEYMGDNEQRGSLDKQQGMNIFVLFQPAGIRTLMNIHFYHFQLLQTLFMIERNFQHGVSLLGH